VRADRQRGGSTAMILEIASATKDSGCGSGRKPKSKPCEHWSRDWLQTVVSLPDVLQDAWLQSVTPALIGTCRSCRDVVVLFFTCDDEDTRDVPFTAKDIRDFLRGRAA
jgi:hypothetical protein